jgi:DNA-binding NarL/FixJ family response regulator
VVCSVRVNVGAALAVTQKTVETHLRHVFQKLDVTKRTELVGALGAA